MGPNVVWASIEAWPSQKGHGIVRKRRVRSVRSRSRNREWNRMEKLNCVSGKKHLLNLVTSGPAKALVQATPQARRRTEKSVDDTHKRTEGNYVGAIWVIGRGCAVRWPWRAGWTNERAKAVVASVVSENIMWRRSWHDVILFFPATWAAVCRMIIATNRLQRKLRN